MSQTKNLADDPVIQRLVQRIRQLEYASNQNNMAIGRSGLRVHSGGVITIENGGLVVTGTAEVIGQLLASGIINLTGEVNISGPLNVSGLVQLMSDLVVLSGGRISAGSIELNPDGSAKFGSMTISPEGKITSGSAEINPDGSTKFGGLTISAEGKITSGSAEINPDGSAKFGLFNIAANGDLDSDGKLDINGPATLNNDLTVAAGKKIKLGGLTLENTGNGGGTVNFPNGSVSSGAFGMLMASSVQVEIGTPNLKFSGIGTETGVTPNLYIDGNGQIKKII